MNKLIFVSYGTHTTNYVASVGIFMRQDTEVTKSLPIYNTHPKSYYILVKKKKLETKGRKNSHIKLFPLIHLQFFLFSESEIIHIFKE